MNFLNCNCRCNCTLSAAIISLIIGIIAAFLQITSVIAVSSLFLWVAFGIAIAYLAVLLLARRTESFECVCFILNALLLGLLGTILISGILLLIDIAATSVISAILVGLLAFFFSLALTNSACLVKCRSNCPAE